MTVPGSGSGFKSVQVVLGANNRDLKGTLLESSRAVNAFQKDVERSNKGLATKGNLLKVGLAAGATAGSTSRLIVKAHCASTAHCLTRAT